MNSPPKPGPVFSKKPPQPESCKPISPAANPSLAPTSSNSSAPPAPPASTSTSSPPACLWTKQNSRPCRSRPRPHSTELPGRARRNRQRNLRHQVSRAKTSRPRMAKAAPHRRHAEFRHPSPQHRSTRRNARHRRIFQRHAHRIRQRAVLRLGLRQSRKPSAHARPVRSFRRISETRTGKIEGKNPHRIRGPGLLRQVSETLHGRLGPQAHAHHSERRRASLPRRASHSRPHFRKREGP